MVSSIEDLAYIAGLLDGEGCITITSYDGRRRSGLRVTITNTYRPVLEWIQSIYGGSMCPTGNGRKSINWYISGGVACQLLVDVKEFLRIKSNRAEIGIEFQISKNTYSGCGPSHRTWSESELGFQEDCRNLISQLNKEGEDGF